MVVSLLPLSVWRCQVWLASRPAVTRRSGWANWSPLTGSSIAYVKFENRARRLAITYALTLDDTSSVVWRQAPDRL